MKLYAVINGDLDKYLKTKLSEAEQAVTAAIHTSTTSLKDKMRTQVKAAGLGPRLAKSWRSDVYPKSGKSLKAAGMVYTKATKIMENFEDGKIIKNKNRFWLAIPTPNAPKKIMGKRITPSNLEKARGIKLRFVYRKNGASMLVAENMRVSYKGKTVKFRGFKSPTQPEIKSSYGLTSVVMFWMVPQVKMPKLISFESEAAKCHSRIPELILKYWKD